MKKLLLLALVLLPGRILAQPSPGQSRTDGFRLIGGLPATCSPGQVRQVSDTISYCKADGTFATITSGGGVGANTALSNLASVAINAALIPGTAGALAIGSATKPWSDIHMAGTSSTPATNRFVITGASTGGTRTITIPDASGTLSLQGASPIGVGSSIVIERANEGATGTTTNRLVRITSAGTAITTSDTTDAIGICVSGCGTTGNATIAVIGSASCVFSGATTAGNYVGVGASGQCTDLGSTFPTGVMVIGRVLTTNGGAGTYTTTLFLTDVASSSGGGNGKGQSVKINGTNAPGNILDFNSSTPAPGTGYRAATFATSQSGATSSVIAKLSIIEAPLYPISSTAVTAGMIYPGVHVGAGSGMKYYEGMVVEDATALTSDAVWDTEYYMPQNIPLGTQTIRYTMLSTSSSQDAKVTTSWACVSTGADPSSATMNAEAQATLSVAASQSDKYQIVDVALDASTACTAGQFLVVKTTFNDTGWTIGSNSTWRQALIWVP